MVFENGKNIAKKNFFWTTGVTTTMIEGMPEDSYGRGKRLLVDGYSKVITTPNIYAIGDTSLMTADRNFPQGHPQLAQVVLQ